MGQGQEQEQEGWMLQDDEIRQPDRETETKEEQRSGAAGGRQVKLMSEEFRRASRKHKHGRGLTRSMNHDSSRDILLTNRQTVLCLSHQQTISTTSCLRLSVFYKTHRRSKVRCAE